MKRIIAKINKQLSLFEEGCYGLDKEETLYPKEDRWINWGNAELQTMKRYFRGNLVTATWVLAALAWAAPAWNGQPPASVFGSYETRPRGIACRWKPSRWLL